MTKIKRTAGVLSTVFTVLLILGVLAMLIFQLLGIRPYIVMSGSMEPAIHTGSICFVDTKADYSDAKKDDIIAFRAGKDTMVTHRVITVTNAGLETKGDANDVSDGLSTTEDNFIGKTLFSIPYAGYWSKGMQTDTGKTVIGVFAAVLIASVVFSKRTVKASKEKQS